MSRHKPQEKTIRRYKDRRKDSKSKKADKCSIRKTRKRRLITRKKDVTSKTRKTSPRHLIPNNRKERKEKGHPASIVGQRDRRQDKILLA
ncbi:hypothetical protein CHS0354_029365 [Potamilus streckersoni]|uniref:Uncharacterized protein n=1 Tax=Potamilus streckersoni TaxID=2493646 RepID=A0AAE0W2F2_9BIVA|nr:hypothetical protein CHS0354_029365 [Potamilus streckersoni]